MKNLRLATLIIITILLVITLDKSYQDESVFASDIRIEQSQNSTLGPLSGKTIVINPGHGWYWNGSQWVLQRQYYFGAVEDFLTIDIARYLNGFLLAQGATIYSTRELDSAAGIGVSGNPKWQEAARYYLEAQGVDESIWNSLPNGSDWDNDIRSRPLYANSLGADILVSVHTNGGGGTGTETWYDSSNGQQTESEQLSNSIHNQVVNYIQNISPSWTDRGVKSASGNYGENRLADMPASLVEVAFHDRQFPDNVALKDEEFKRLVALAICDGILEYFGESGSCNKLLIDQGHDDYWSILPNCYGCSYSGFVDTLLQDNYQLDFSYSQISQDDLAPYLGYIIPLAGFSPTEAEIQALQQYVADGGSLFLIADWGGIYSDPSQALANSFGVTLDANTVTDPNDHIYARNYWIFYGSSNFSSHSIMNGLNNLQTYASTSMIPGTATPLIITDADASPPNRAIAVSLNYGAGRVVILGDSNYFADYHELGGDPLEGLNAADNKQYAVNIVNWLTKKPQGLPADSQLAFFDDGEGGTDNWTADSPWSLTVVDSLDRNKSEEVNHSWTDSPSGVYANNTDISLTSIGIDISSLTNPMLSFMTHYEIEAGNDYGFVEVSTDNGNTWINVATYTGVAANWITEQISLQNLAGATNLRLRFRLFSNSTNNYDGWYIDDVKIFSGPVIYDNYIYLPLISRSDENALLINVIVPPEVIEGTNPGISNP